MSKKIVIISSSMRNNSNSDLLAQAFAKGAQESGSQVELIRLKRKKLQFCTGCLACQNTQKCVLSDDAVEIAEKVKNADVVVFASPVYYYSISGQLKTLFDRMNPLFVSDYRFREVYFLTCAFDGDAAAAEGSIKAVEGWVSCFGKAELKKTIFAGGVGVPGEAKEHPALQEAYQAGRTV